MDARASIKRAMTAEDRRDILSIVFGEQLAIPVIIFLHSPCNGLVVSAVVSNGQVDFC